MRDILACLEPDSIASVLGSDSEPRINVHGDINKMTDFSLLAFPPFIMPEFYFFSGAQLTCSVSHVPDFNH